MPINALNTNFPGKDKFGLFCSFIKFTKFVVPEQIVWLSKLYGPCKMLNAYIVVMLLDCTVQPYHTSISAISVTDLFKKELQSMQKDPKLTCISKWERQQI